MKLIHIKLRARSVIFLASAKAVVQNSDNHYTVSLSIAYYIII